MPKLDDSFFFGSDSTESDNFDDSFFFSDKPKKEDTTFLQDVGNTISGVADVAVDTAVAIPKYAYGFFEGGGAAIENRRSIASKISASLDSAAVGTASALGQLGTATNEFFGYEGKDALTDALNQYVDDNSTRVSKRLDTAIKGLQDAELKQNLTKEGEFFREAGTSALETTGSMLLGGATKSVATGILAMAPQVFGQSYNELKKEGEGEKGAVLHGAAKTAIELASEILPLKKLLNLPEGIVRKIADMTAVEGGTEMASSIGDSLYDSSVRGKDLDWGVEWDKAVKSFQLGAAAGGMIGTAAAAPQIAGKVVEGAVDTAKGLKDTAVQFKNSLGEKAEPIADSPGPDQTGQPTELFNPTHKADGGTDVQVATKNGKIIPDTYIDESGNTIRDANAVPNDPDVSVNVENDVSAVVASIKAEIRGEKAGAPEQQANDVIDSLEQQNQQVIDSAFSAPAPEAANQGIINSQRFEPTIPELNQVEIDSNFDDSAVLESLGAKQTTQAELNQKKIEGMAAGGLVNVTQKAEPEVIKAESPKKLEPKSKLETVQPDITKAETLKPSEILKYSTDKPRLSAQKMSDLTKSIQDKGITRPAILLKNKKGKVTLEDGHHITRIADELGIDVPVKVIEQKKYETDVQVASRVLDAVEATSIKTEPVGETTTNIEKVANEASTSLKNDLPQPTQAQIESGNYKKAHVKVQGLDITIENPKGSKREGIDPNGKKWSVTMPSSYGYFKGSTGADSAKGATGNKIEQLDTYIGDSPESQEVFIVNQQDPDTGKFDELKVIVGTENINDAMGIYYGGFSDGTGGSRAKSVYQLPISEFKELLNKGLGTKEIDKSSLLKKISPLKLKKLARETGADKLVTPKIKSKEVVKNEGLQTESKGNAVQEKTPEKTEGANKLSNEGTQQSPDVDSYRAMRGKEISYEVETEDTGETFTVTVDAGTVMNELDTRLDALQELRNCI